MKRFVTVILLSTIYYLLSTSPNFAAVENIKISGDVTTQGIARDVSFGLDAPLYGSSTSYTKDEEAFIISQTRLQFDADLTEDVQACLRLLDERVWGTETTTDTDIDLDLAYLKLDNFLSLPLSITLGRQNLRFGNGFIVGDPDGNRDTSSGSALYHIADDLSLRKSFDALRFTLDLEPTVLDLIYSTINEGTTNKDDDIALYGFNLNYSPDKKNTYELYMFAKDKATSSEDDENDVYCLGSHTKKDLNDHLTLNFEAAHQFGEYIDGSSLHAKRDAWGAQLGLDYKFLNKTYSILGFWYTYLSGDADDYAKGAGYTAGAKFTGWDNMFEDQTGGDIINLILAGTNSHNISLYYFTYLHKKINMLLKYNHTRLVKNHYSNRYPITGGPAYLNYYYISDSKHLADEVDLKLTYDYSENTQFELKTNLALPGGILAQENDENAYCVTLKAKLSF